MSVDGDDILSRVSEDTGASREVIVFGAWAAVLLGIFWLLRRRAYSGNSASSAAPDTGQIAVDSGNGQIILPVSALYGVQNAILNGPWNTASIDANPAPTSPDGGADNTGTVTHVYQGGDTYPANGETLQRIADMFGAPVDDLYYNGANSKVQAYLTGAAPKGASVSTKVHTIGITMPVYITHSATKTVTK